MTKVPSRRDVLRGSVAGAFLPFLPWWARGITELRERDRHLVILRLLGGNDSLNTLIPHEDSRYHEARPGLRVRDALPLAGGLAFHPSLRPLLRAWKEGELTVLPGIGYPGPNRSHFRSMDIWESGIVDRVDTRSGWLGRFADAEPDAGPTLLSVGEKTLPLALLSRRSDALVVEDPARMRFAPQVREAFLPLLDLVQEACAESELEREVRTQFEAMRRCVDAWSLDASAARAMNSDLGRSLGSCVDVMRARLGPRVFLVSQSGYDTHARQADLHPALLGDLARVLATFWDTLTPEERERTTVFVYSEFGRRVKENGSRGTDHGAAGTAFLLSKRGAGGIHGLHPSLANLDDGDLRFTLDFRSVHRALLENWMGASVEDSYASVKKANVLRS